MNTYSIAADSRRWWWLSATAGAIATAAVTAILVVPATSSVTPLERPITGGGSVTEPVAIVKRPCYLARPEWNTPRGTEHPVCTTQLGHPAEIDASGDARPMPDYQP